MRDNGAASDLLSIVNQHATALHLMFTACGTTCPIQAAIFQRVQHLLVDQVARGIQLLSLSIDPEHDTPAVLSQWLERFHARPGWVAAAPHLKDLERLRDFAGRGQSASDNHSTQVLLLDRKGRLFWRTSELPEAEEFVDILRQI